MPDKYDRAIDILRDAKDFKQAVYNAWNAPFVTDGGELFVYMTPSGEDDYADEVQGYVNCGCLTQVKCGTSNACTPELTNAIRADARIPSDPKNITLEDLKVFAEWQRKLDVMFNRK